MTPWWYHIFEGDVHSLLSFHVGHDGVATVFLTHGA